MAKKFLFGRDRWFAHPAVSAALCYLKKLDDIIANIDPDAPSPQDIALISTLMGQASAALCPVAVHLGKDSPLYIAWFNLEFNRAYRKRSGGLILGLPRRNGRRSKACRDAFDDDTM